MAAALPAAPRRGASSLSCRWRPDAMPDAMSDKTVDGFNLTGKRALVVGAETPVGRAIAGGLAEAGARLALASGLGYGEGQAKPALPSGNGLSGAVGLTDSGSETDLIRAAVDEL